MITEFELTTGLLTSLQTSLDKGLNKRAMEFSFSRDAVTMNDYERLGDTHRFVTKRLRCLKPRRYNLLAENEQTLYYLHRVMDFAEPEYAEISSHHQSTLTKIKKNVFFHRNASPLERLAMEAE